MKITTVKINLVFFIVLCVFGFGLYFGCASQTSMQNAYNTADMSKLAYDTAMKSAAMAYEDGLIDDQQKNEIIKTGQIYMDAHNAMVEALEAYLNNPDKQQAYLDAYTIASQELLKLLNLINIERSN